MGAVFSAREIGLNRLVALKILHPGYVGDDDSKQRFNLEAKVIANLSHKNLCTCFRFGVEEQDSTPYIAMEFLQGKTLRLLLNEHDKLSWQRAVRIVAQTAEAMDYVHSCGVIHRDLKPNNIILLDREGEDFVKVLDFGLAKIVENQEQHLTQSGLLLGSVPYMSPEQCQAKRVDHRSDIYSLGCILYECVSGEAPFSADTPIGILHRHVNDEPGPLGADVPATLKKVISAALAKNLNDRYQSMFEFHSDLLAVLDCNAAVDEVAVFHHPAQVRRGSVKAGLIPVALITLLLIVVPVLLASDPIKGEVVALIVRVIGSSEGAKWGVDRARELISGQSRRSAEVVLKACEDVDPRSDAFTRVSIKALQSKIQWDGGNLEKSESLVQSALEGLDQAAGKRKQVAADEISAVQDTLASITIKSSNVPEKFSELGCRYLAVGELDLLSSICNCLIELASSANQSKSRTAAETVAPFLCHAIATALTQAGKQPQAVSFAERGSRLGQRLRRLSASSTDLVYRRDILTKLSSRLNSIGYDARPALKQALQLQEQGESEESKIPLMLMLCVEERQHNKDDTSIAENMAKSVLQLCQRDPQRLWQSKASALMELALAYKTNGSFSEARRYMTICENVLSQHHAVNPSYCFERAYLEASSGNNESAEKYCHIARTLPHDWQMDYCIDCVEFQVVLNKKGPAAAEDNLLAIYARYKDRWDPKALAGFLTKLEEVRKERKKLNEATR